MLNGWEVMDKAEVDAELIPVENWISDLAAKRKAAEEKQASGGSLGRQQ